MHTYRVDDETIVRADDCVQGQSGSIAFVNRETFERGAGSLGPAIVHNCVAAFSADNWSRVVREDVEAFAKAVDKLKHLGATVENAAGVAVARLATMQGGEGKALSPAAMMRVITDTMKKWIEVPDQPQRRRADQELFDSAWMAVNALPYEIQQAAGLYPGIALAGAAKLMAEYLTACATRAAEEPGGKARYADRIAVFRSLTDAGLFNDRRAAEDVSDGLTVQAASGTGEPGGTTTSVFLKLRDLKARLMVYRDGGVELVFVDGDRGVIASASHPSPAATLPFVPDPGEVPIVEEGQKEPAGGLTVVGDLEEGHPAAGIVEPLTSEQAGRMFSAVDEAEANRRARET
jgi:hypothetical protein